MMMKAVWLYPRGGGGEWLVLAPAGTDHAELLQLDAVLPQVARTVKLHSASSAWAVWIDDVRAYAAALAQHGVPSEWRTSES